MARTRTNITVATEGRPAIEVSTIETLRYEHQYGRGGFIISLPPYAVRKIDGVIMITVYHTAHEDFIARNLGNTFVIRSIRQDEEYNNLTPESKWKKLQNVKFYRKDGTQIEDPNISFDDLEDIEI